MAQYDIAQVNVGRIKADLDDPSMAGFLARVDEINALASAWPGFVWRHRCDQSCRRLYGDDRILFDLSVWRTIEQLNEYLTRIAREELARDRIDWFNRFVGAQVALWWVPRGHLPCLDEAKKRLDHLAEYGSSQFAFTFKTVLPPDDAFLRAFDWSNFEG